jgi:glycogen debranching enzyme
MGIEDIRDALVIRERSVFLLTDPTGNVAAGNTQGFGMYSADTRHLSAYDFSLNGIAPVLLLSTAELGYAMEQVMTNPTLITDEGRTITRGSVEFRRQRVVADLVEERLRVTNFNPFPVKLSLLYRFGADFSDIFDVRGTARARRRGTCACAGERRSSPTPASMGANARRRGSTARRMSQRVVGAVPRDAETPRDGALRITVALNEQRQAVRRQPLRCGRGVAPELGDGCTRSSPTTSSSTA